MGDVTPLPNAHIYVEQHALDVIPVECLVPFLHQYGLELVRSDGRLVIRRADGPEAA